MNIETERKFLIERPTENLLRAQPGIRILDMVQTYLMPDGNTERRVRRITENGADSCIYTEKRPVDGSKISRYEDERTVSEEEYRRLTADCISELTKTRFSFPYGGHTVEIDIYPYDIGGDALEGKAVLEVELSSPDEAFDLPRFITVLRELTGTREFSNKALAKPKRAE
ncbi:MAG: hypothetical protein IJC71_07740 [Clostridia bacterium]|nr:hypothetical protein [Clostridia bacterium]